MEPRGQTAGPDESARTRLNGFFRYALNHEALSHESAERLQSLNDDAANPFLDSDVTQALSNRELPEDIPLIPTLRRIGDFSVGQSVQILQEPAARLTHTSLSENYGSYLTAAPPRANQHTLMQLIAPGYVGLITQEEYQFYQYRRRGAGGKTGPETGTRLSYIYANTEFARLLSQLDIGPIFDYGVIVTIRRHFRVTTHPYTPFKTHLVPLTEA